MKTENLTHGSSKAVREVSVIVDACAKNDKGLFSTKSENSVNFHFGQVTLAKSRKIASIISQGKYNDSID